MKQAIAFWAAAFVVCAAPALGQESLANDIKDGMITARIETIYLLNDDLSPFGINTTTKNGVVTLSGTVESEIDKELAGDLAKTVKDVTEVKNELTVEPSDKPRFERGDWNRQVSDARLRANVRRRIAYTREYRDNKVNVSVDGQVVTLTGSVRTEAQKDDIEETVEDIPGVRDVKNDLQVIDKDADTKVAERDDDESDGKSIGQDIEDAAKEVGAAISDEWVEKKVETALMLNRQVSIWDLDVDVTDGQCTLEGTVISQEQKELAGDIAQRTDGVDDVKNDISITPWNAKRTNGNGDQDV